jgi:hypothetical protein
MCSISQYASVQVPLELMPAVCTKSLDSLAECEPKMFLGNVFCIVKMIPFTLRSNVHNEGFAPFVLFCSARARFRYKLHSRLACVPRNSGCIALINGACHLNKGHSTICTSWLRAAHIVRWALRTCIGMTWAVGPQPRGVGREFFPLSLG